MEITSQEPVFHIPHEVLKAEFPLSVAAIELVEETKNSIRRILDGDDPRMIALVGPCSIYGEDATLEYGARLSRLAQEVRSQFLIIMRYCVAKPRTNGGWKGIFKEPNLLRRSTTDIPEGQRISRKLAVNLLELGIPIGGEILDNEMIEYLDDALSYAWIGARTVETPLLRSIAPGFSMPVGMKNTTRADIAPAINAMIMAKKESWWSGTRNGRVASLRGKGNSHPHLILRGGRIAETSIKNYSKYSIETAEAELKKHNVLSRVIVDCSHDNSNKDHTLQRDVLFNLVEQRQTGSPAIAGFMMESNLIEGRQDIPLVGSPQPGLSLTDGCMGIEETEQILRNAARLLS